MSDLPTGWAISSLKELLTEDGMFSDGDWVESKDQDPNGSIRLLQLADIGDGYFVDKSCRFINEQKFAELRCTELFENDVLIARMPDPLGRACLMPRLPQRCVTVVDVAVFRTGKGGVSSNWLMHTINAPQYRAEIELNSSGTTRKRISRGNLAAMAMPVAPFPEQKRIADKLDSVLARVDACRDRLDRLPALLKRFRQTILAAATSGKLTDDWRLNHATGTSSEKFDSLLNIQGIKREWLAQNAAHNEASRVKKRLLSFEATSISNSQLPETWCWAALEDATLMVVDCHNKTAPYQSTGIPLVRTTNIRDGQFVWDDLRFVSEETYRFWSKRCFPQPGDIVFTREAPMGEASIIPENTKICLGQRTMLIRPLSECTSPNYLLIALLDPMFKERAFETAVGTGVKHLRVGDVSELKLPLPPTNEQTEIVRRVALLFAFADRLEARLATARRQVGQLTPALLAKAFRGELVPQDPADEPAAELLKRLAAQREATPKARRGRASKA